MPVCVLVLKEQVAAASLQEKLRANGFDPSNLENLTLIHHVGNSAVRRGEIVKSVIMSK